MKKASVIVGMALCFFGQVQAQNDDFGDDFKEDFESFRRAIHKDFNNFRKKIKSVGGVYGKETARHTQRRRCASGDLPGGG